jgi:hypothetical protein
MPVWLRYEWRIGLYPSFKVLLMKRVSQVSRVLIKVKVTPRGVGHETTI